MSRMPDKPDNQDWLDKMLAGCNDDYIHDGGFTERVMDSLPARRQPAPRALILGCASLLALAVLLLSAPSPALLYSRFVDFLYAQPLLHLFAMTVAIASAISAIAWWVIDPDI